MLAAAPEFISSRDNPLLKALRRLARESNAYRKQVVLGSAAECTKSVIYLLLHKAWPAKAQLHGDGPHPALRPRRDDAGRVLCRSCRHSLWGGEMF